MSPENDNQDLQPQPVVLKDAGEKRSAQDPSLDLVRKPAVNRKMLQAGIVAFASVAFVGIILGFQPNNAVHPESFTTPVPPPSAPTAPE